MIDYGTAFIAALLVSFQTVGALAMLGGTIWLVHRMITTSGKKSAQALGAILLIVGVVFLMSVVFRFGGDPSLVNGMVHGA